MLSFPDGLGHVLGIEPRETDHQGVPIGVLEEAARQVWDAASIEALKTLGRVYVLDYGELILEVGPRLPLRLYRVNRMLHREPYTPTSDRPEDRLTYDSTTHPSKRTADVECHIVLRERLCDQPAAKI